MKKKIIQNIGEMKDFANFYIKNLKKEQNKAEIIILIGDLGSGKTTFIQQIANIFEIKEYITSPTFVIQKKYKINNLPAGRQVPSLGFENLIHIDAYRLESGKELLDLNWEENINNSQNIIFIEWPERVSDILPKDVNKISFKFIDENSREIIF
ncbi:MAG: tRNA (adenosine(37)-N6)-threonylcarbamoyltransferase complex ATPase subunit type 1 TsaE [Candidatus Pacebacteria bacterium]|nr:tRNA (adenosine(37)-N6)-threonylcarbamoyltransferase complex ATPase subunit type 1 TsaE [Candidatus Paceibacterota bacterium]